jgi:cytochrome c
MVQSFLTIKTITMKKTFMVVIVGFMLVAAACSNEAADNNNNQAGGDTATTQNETPAPAPSTSDAEKQKGVELIAQSDCLTCHKVEEKLVGPSYREVANKYASDEQTKALLAEKIIKGGKGVWGEIAMTPHPAITEEDAKAMVTYILSLKQN